MGETNFKLLAILTFIISVFGCNIPESAPYMDIDTTDIQIKRIGDCEYIIYHGYGYDHITHKGDCDNPKHCHNR